MRNIDVSTTMTYPETAWLVSVVPVALTVAAILVAIFILRGQLTRALIDLTARRAATQRRTLPANLLPDVALHWNPPTIPPAQFLAICTGAGLVLMAALSLVAPMFIALVMVGPLTALLVWAMVLLFEGKYVHQIERQLTPAVGRLSAMLRSGNSYRQALDKLLVDMDEGPLRREWRFLLERQGVPLAASEGIATAQQVVAALAVQTPSRRHATFLNHLAVAVGQPQDVLVARCAAAYEALQASDRRQEEAVTELAQMRYSGMAVGLAGLVMALYLIWTQWERVVVAYSTPLGAAVGVVVAFSLLLPIAGGALLARADDVDY
jgi:Flp pilus assembly protein TadB